MAAQETTTRMLRAPLRSRCRRRSQTAQRRRPCRSRIPVAGRRSRAERARARPGRLGRRIRASRYPPYPPLPRREQRLHATAPSLKVQTVERVLEYLEHYAPSTHGAMRVVGCNPYLALRFSRYVARERTLDAFVRGMVAKRGGRERMLVAFGDFSRFPNSPIRGHVRAAAGLTLARRMQR